MEKCALRRQALRLGKRRFQNDTYNRTNSQLLRINPAPKLPKVHPIQRGCNPPSLRRAGPLQAANDWNYQSYRTAGDWHGAPGAYTEPRVVPPNPSREESAPNSPSRSFDEDQVPQAPDPLSDLVRSGVDIATGFLAFLVGGLSDTALSLLPAHVKRRAVENCVKGGLALVGLALLQSVLTFILTVGTLVLVLYAAHQVFGVQLPFLPPGAVVPSSGGASGPPGQEGSGYPRGDPRVFSQQGGYMGRGAGRQPGAFPYDPYQQGYYNGAGYAGGGPGRGPRPAAGGSGYGNSGGRGVRQGPTIDVYYEST